MFVFLPVRRAHCKGEEVEQSADHKSTGAVFLGGDHMTVT